jgi:hypothetical protein
MISAATETFCRCTFADREGRVGIITAAVRALANFVLRNNLYLMALGVAVASYVALNWSSMPVLQRMVGLFFVGLVMRLWEEGRFPGAGSSS